MKNGCVLCGGVGSGKSITALAYYFQEQGGDPLDAANYPMEDPPQDLYIITTAHKRDSYEWEGEMIPFLITPHPEDAIYQHKVIIDSWNNITKYTDVRNAFFIFDEQRVVGKGAWVEAFLQITKSNQWILLSATPGDNYEDYLPLFLANGFFRNKSEFYREHCVYSRYSKFPKIDKYLGTQRLDRLCRAILIDMPVERHTVCHHEDVHCSYDISAYKDIFRERWNIWENRPMENAAELCYCLRKVVNSDESRIVALMEVLEKHPKLIVFYNFDYELDILKNASYGDEVEIAEWNGHKHQTIPEGKSWLYFVQYTAGAEGWNCIKTDTMVFFSQNYSYKTLEQARGRIDRLNTPFVDLYYYHFKSRSGIDLAISRALTNKKKFNESRWVNNGK